MPTRKSPSAPVMVFCSYSHKDERQKNNLLTHLKVLERSGVVSTWHDRKITAGQDWATEIDTHLKKAKIVLLLISANFMASDYCTGIELKQAMRRHARGTARVIPIILKPCVWQIMPLHRLQALPKDGKPITRWTNKDAAYTDVAEGIRRAVEDLTAVGGATKNPSVPKQASTNEKPRSAPITPRPRTTQPVSKVVPPAQAGKPAGDKSASIQPAPQRKRPTPVTSNTKATKSRREPATPVTSAVFLPREIVSRHVEEAFKDRPKRHSGIVWLQGVWVSMREDAPLKPTLFIDDKFREDVQRVAHAGKPPLFPFGTRNVPQHNTSRLQIVQQHAIADGRGGQDEIQLTLYANGAVAVALNVTNLSGRDMNNWSAGIRINPDDVQRRLEQAWGFAVRWWRHHFKTRASSGDKLLYNIGLFDTDQYRFERPPQSLSNSYSLSTGSRPNPLMIHNEPKLISGSVFARPGPEISDAVKMLQMRFDELERFR